MSLKDNPLAVLHARRGGLAEHDVSGRILEGFDTSLFGEVEQELLDLLKMSAGARYLCQCVEILPDARRVQILNFVHSCLSFFEEGERRNEEGEYLLQTQ